MPILTGDQIKRANGALDAWLAAPSDPDGRTRLELDEERDAQRKQAIDDAIRPLVMDYLTESVDFDDFKTRIVSANQRRDLWDFLGVEGLGFFDAYVAAAPDVKARDRELRQAISAPTSNNLARVKIQNFVSHVKRHGAQLNEDGSPDPASIPYFLSWFWQCQDRDTWPICNSACVTVMLRLKLLRTTDDFADDYVVLKQIYEELADAFKNRRGKFFGCYEVERVLRHAAGTAQA
jgi:hypothetical protein